MLPAAGMPPGRRGTHRTTKVAPHAPWEFELLHVLASVVLSLYLFLEELVLCHCMTVLSPVSSLRGHALLIGCVELLPMSLGTDF